MSDVVSDHASASVVPADGGPVPDPRPSLAGTRLDSLTGLRWIAAFTVFGYHFHLYKIFGGRTEGWIDWAFLGGPVGVSFFFILSGFVLGWSAGEHVRPLQFWRRRFARIWPLHLATAALATAMAFFVAAQPKSTVGQTIANLLLVSSWKANWWQVVNPVSWTLCCEAFFYACFPLLFLLVRRLRGAGLWAVAVVALAAVYALAWAADNGHLGIDVNSNPLARLPEFVLGVALSRLVLTGAWRWAPVTSTSVLAVFGYFFFGQADRPYHWASCTVLGFALLIPAVAVNDLRGGPNPLRHPVMVKLGEWSFAFYLVHLLIFRLIIDWHGLDRPVSISVGLAYTVALLGASLTAAWALHTFIERPAQRLLTGRRRRPRGPARADGAVA